MTQQDEQRFTLDEARAELTRQECERYGHSWDVIENRTMGDPTPVPSAIVCTRCRVSHRVVES